MKIFLDSANLDDIKECVLAGVIEGVTINQSLLAKEPKRPYLEHVKDIAVILNGLYHLSAPITEANHDKAVEQATQLYRIVGKRFAAKVPVSWQTLPLIRALSDKKITVNATCIYSGQQAELAAAAGASFLSVFVGRINDVNKDVGYATVAKAKKFSTPEKPYEVIAGSVRDDTMVAMVFTAGADIVTTSKKVLMSMASVEKSLESAQKFDKDFEAWTQPQ